MRQRTGTTCYLALVILLVVGVLATSQASAVGSNLQDVASPTSKKPFKHRKLKEPIQLADGLEVVYYWIAPRVAWDNSFQIYGEIINKTDRTLDAPAFLFTLYDEDGNTLGGVSAQPLYHVIPPGRPMPFQGNGTDEGIELKSIKSVDAALCGSWGGQWGDTMYVDEGYGLDFIEIVSSETVEKSTTELKIEGTVRNNGLNAVAVRIQAAVFDPSGRYLGSADTYTGAAINPGKTGRFVLETYPGQSSSALPLDRVKDDDYIVELWAGVDNQIWFTC